MRRMLVYIEGEHTFKDRRADSIFFSHTRTHTHTQVGRQLDIKSIIDMHTNIHTTFIHIHTVTERFTLLHFRQCFSVLVERLIPYLNDV